jgi:hypothetical protein
MFLDLPDVPNISSLGRIAVELQVAPRTLQRVLDALGIRPACVINGQPLYDAPGDDVVAAVRAAQRQRRGDL